MRTICVYCGSSDKIHPDYLQAASVMGEVFARQGLSLVYGAGSTGLMGALANAALESGGEVIGVIPEYLNTPALAHRRLSRLEVVDTIHARKARMIELADAIVALPGGYGTLEELFEALTWAQIGLHSKPIGLLNVRGYFDPLLVMVKRAHEEGFIYNEQRALFTWANQPAELLESLKEHRHPDDLQR